MKKFIKIDHELLKQVNAILEKEVDSLYFKVARKIAPELGDSKYLPWLLAHKMPLDGCKVLLALPDPDWKQGMGEYEVTSKFIQMLVDKYGLTEEFIKKQLEESYFNGDVFCMNTTGPVITPNRGLWVDSQSGRKWRDRNGPAYYRVLRFMQEQESTMIAEVEHIRHKKEGKNVALGRIVPRYDSVKDCPDLLPGENYKEILKSKKLLSQNQCPCRFRYPELDSDPGVCLSADSVAEWAIKHDSGEEISWKEAFDYVQKSGKKFPHCHAVSNDMELEDIGGVLCNCHSEACSILRHTKVNGDRAPHKMWERFNKSRFRAVINAEKCIDCGLCMNKRCMFDAIEPRYQKGLAKELPWVDEVKCMGCGCRAETCPADAIKMKLVDPPEALYGYNYDENGKPMFRTASVEKKKSDEDYVFNPTENGI